MHRLTAHVRCAIDKFGVIQSSKQGQPELRFCCTWICESSACTTNEGHNSQGHPRGPVSPVTIRSEKQRYEREPFVYLYLAIYERHITLRRFDHDKRSRLLFGLPDWPHSQSPAEVWEDAFSLEPSGAREHVPFAEYVCSWTLPVASMPREEKTPHPRHRFLITLPFVHDVTLTWV